MHQAPQRRIVWVWAAYLAACGAFGAAAGIAFGLPPWLLLRDEAVQSGILGLAYVLATLVPLSGALKRAPCPAWLVAVLAGCAFVAAWFGAKAIGIEIPLAHTVPLGILAAGVNLLLLRAGRPGHGGLLRGTVLALACLVVCSILPGVPPLRDTALARAVYRNLEQPVSRVVPTGLHNVQVNFFRARIPASQSQGGGLALAGDMLLLVTGDGLIYLLTLSADSERLEVQPIDRTVPVNRGEFLESPLGPENIKDFRALSMLLLDAGSPSTPTRTLLASHHYWHRERSCYVLRVSVARMPWQEFVAGSEPSGWETLYETSPCLPLKPGTAEFFAGNQSGGQMVQSGPDTVLLTVGDHGYDGVYGEPVVAQNPGSSYGKIIEIDIRSGASRVYSLGHRNPQGLYQDADGWTWETEHGPKGGDELNRIDRGGNYGWPVATLGAKYLHFSWPGLSGGDAGTQLVAPLFAWTPSIAVSGLTQVAGGDFSRWQGDLMAASLAARSVHRVHMVDGHPMMAEPIRLGERLRHIVRDSGGRLVLWTDRGDVGVLKRAPETDEDPE